MTTSLRQALAERIDAVGPAHADLDAVIDLGEARLRRRRRQRVALVATPALLGALILGWGATEQLRDSTAPAPATRPSQHPARLLTLVAHPLEPQIWGIPIRPGVQPAALSRCISSPLTWSAPDSYAATFGPADVFGNSVVANEFVLRYKSAGRARRAVGDAWRQSSRCPSRRIDLNFWQRPTPDPNDNLNEWFTNTHFRDGRRYMLRVARRENLVVVVENTGNPEDKYKFTLWMAMFRATGNP